MNALITKLREERDSLKESISAICETAATETRDLNETEDQNLSDLASRLESVNTRLEQLEKIELRNAQAIELSNKVDKAPAEHREVGGAHVTSEEKTYHQRSEHSFLSDAYRAQFMGDPSAQSRIGRHMQEMETEYRAVGTGNFNGLVVPQFLSKEFANLARAGRVLANQVRNTSLPENGMTLTIPRLSTGTAVGVQAGEGTAVTQVDPGTTTFDVPVKTIAGSARVSRQAIERGDGVDTIIFGDLAAAHAVTLDRQVISGVGGANEMLGILNTAGITTVTYTDTTPTVQELYPKLADAIQGINSSRFLPAEAIFMHPRRWGWLVAAADTTGRPLVVPDAQGPANAIANGQAPAYGYVGSMLGLPVYTDANIPTNLGAGANEDRIIVTRLSDLLLAEDPSAPLQLRFDQTFGMTLEIALVVYSYAAFTAQRYPQSTAVIAGSGTVGPTF